MLVLNRKANEEVIITATNGERIRVVLVDIVDARGNSLPLRARLGFEAPPTVTVHREEIQRAIDAEGHVKVRIAD